METTKNEIAQIFVTDYESYNNGNQFEHGHWIDLDQFSDFDGLEEYLNNHFDKIGLENPEIMITDFEGFPKKYYSESFDTTLLESLFEYLEFKKSCHNEEALFAYVNDGNDFDNFDEAFQGQYKDDQDFAYEVAEQLGAIDHKATWPQNCIDWEYAARELMYDYQEIDGYYFRNL